MSPYKKGEKGAFFGKKRKISKNERNKREKIENSKYCKWKEDR